MIGEQLVTLKGGNQDAARDWECVTLPIAFLPVFTRVLRGCPANLACRVFSEVRRARTEMPKFCGKSIMVSGERIIPLRTSGRKEKRTWNPVLQATSSLGGTL